MTNTTARSTPFDRANLLERQALGALLLGQLKRDTAPGPVERAFVDAIIGGLNYNIEQARIAAAIADARIDDPEATLQFDDPGLPGVISLIMKIEAEARPIPQLTARLTWSAAGHAEQVYFRARCLDLRRYQVWVEHETERIAAAKCVEWALSRALELFGLEVRLRPVASD